MRIPLAPVLASLLAAAATAGVATADHGSDGGNRNGERGPAGYREFLTALRDETVAFGKPVVAVHGDSHYFRVDKPLQDAGGRRVQNFTRVETFGNHAENNNNDVQWVKVDVDPNTREVFSFQPQIIAANAAS
jgi:hypothetical protein